MKNIEFEDDKKQRYVIKPKLVFGIKEVKNNSECVIVTFEDQNNELLTAKIYVENREELGSLIETIRNSKEIDLTPYKVVVEKNET
jgi:phage terminase large subunit